MFAIPGSRGKWAAGGIPAHARATPACPAARRHAIRSSIRVTARTRPRSGRTIPNARTCRTSTAARSRSTSRVSPRCKAGERFGAHNLHPNFPGPTSANLKNTTVASWFNGGVRIYRIVDGPRGVSDAPPRLDEIGYYIPDGAQINHAIVDERGLIYANDRSTKGLYILKYTGTTPLD